jgi:hypothetical protein
LWADHWQQQRDRLSALAASARLPDKKYKLYQQMKAWPERLSTILDIISDRTDDPRGFDQIVANDFALVRAMLDRLQQT